MDTSSSSSSIPTFETGMEVEEQSFIWKINDFNVIAKEEELIKLQKLEFTAGDKIGQPSKWMLNLTVETIDEQKWLRINYFAKEKLASTEHLLSRMSITIKNNHGNIMRNLDLTIKDYQSALKGWGQRICHFPFDAGKRDWTEAEALENHITFKLYAPTPSRGAQDVQQLKRKLEEAQVSFGAKARKDLKGLFQATITGDVLIVSSDQKEFHFPKAVLVARSPVFEAMLRSDMAEANRGRMELPDISGKTLKVLLYFIHTGDLLPEWKQGGVIVELTNAAAKYEFADLLSFLDGVLGRVCKLGNVLPLLTLANRLSLKTAEQELLKFIREKGATTTKSMEKIVGGWNDSSQPKLVSY